MALKGQACMVEKHNGSLFRVQHPESECQDGMKKQVLQHAQLNRVLIKFCEVVSQIMVLITSTLKLFNLNQPVVCFPLQVQD